MYSKMNLALFNVRWFYCLYLSGFWIGTERNFSKWNHDGCKTSQNCGWKMQKWHKTAEICQTSKKRTHFQISEACFFDSSSFTLKFSFILIDGLFVALFLSKTVKRLFINKFHRRAQADKTKQKLQVKRAWTKDTFSKAQFFAARWPASNCRSVWTKNYLYWQRCLSRWYFCQKRYSNGRADFLLLWNNVQSKGTSNFL